MQNELEMTESEIKELYVEQRKIHNLTNLHFLKAHNGLRNQKLHVTLGSPSAGKSTLRSSIIADFIKCNAKKKIYLWLSEESEKDYKTDLSNNPALIKLMESRVMVTSEQDMADELDVDAGASQIIEQVLQSNCDLFIFDNVTTSTFYDDQHVSVQNKFLTDFKSALRYIKCPVLFFAHTGKQIGSNHPKLIEHTDIRGSAKLTNIAEYFYILQPFSVGNHINTSLRIAKSRGHSIKNRYYALEYDSSLRYYHADKIIGFDHLNELFKEQDRLGKKL